MSPGHPAGWTLDGLGEGAPRDRRKIKLPSAPYLSKDSSCAGGSFQAKRARRAVLSTPTELQSRVPRTTPPPRPKLQTQLHTNTNKAFFLFSFFVFLWVFFFFGSFAFTLPRNSDLLRTSSRQLSIPEADALPNLEGTRTSRCQSPAPRGATATDPLNAVSPHSPRPGGNAEWFTEGPRGADWSQSAVTSAGAALRRGGFQGSVNSQEQ